MGFSPAKQILGMLFDELKLFCPTLEKSYCFKDGPLWRAGFGTDWQYDENDVHSLRHSVFVSAIIDPKQLNKQWLEFRVEGSALTTDKIARMLAIIQEQQ